MTNNSEAHFRVTVSGMQPGAVDLHRDKDGTALFIYLDPDQLVCIRIDLRPGYDDWEQSRTGLAELSEAAAQAAQEIAELQARAADDAYVREHGGDDLDAGHLRDPEGDEAAHG